MTTTYIEGDIIYSLVDNEYVVGNSSRWENCGNALSNTVKDINILEEINNNGNYFVTRIITNAFCQNSLIETVFIPKTIRIIDYAAFLDCSNLKNLTIASNSQLKQIKGDAFNYCPKLEKVYIPPSVNVIEKYAFGNFSQLSVIVYCGGTSFTDAQIISPANDFEATELKIFVVYGVYHHNYFGKYRVLSTSECIYDQNIKGRFPTYFAPNLFPKCLVFICFSLLK